MTRLRYVLRSTLSTTILRKYWHLTLRQSGKRLSQWRFFPFHNGVRKTRSLQTEDEEFFIFAS
jgi:hypothetical protein